MESKRALWSGDLPSLSGALLLLCLLAAGPKLRAADPVVPTTPTTPTTPSAPSAPSAPSGASPENPAIPGYAPGEGLPTEPGGSQMPQIELIPPGIAPPQLLFQDQGVGAASPLAPQEAGPIDIKKLKYKVSKFTVKYGPPDKPAHAGLPPVQQLADIQVSLGQSKEPDGGLVGPGAGARDFPVTLSQVKTPETFSGDALQAIYEAVVKVVNKQGIYGVFVIVDPTQVNISTGEDLRKGNTDLTLLVYASEVRKVRTIIKPVPKAPFKAASTSINDPKYHKITDHSPLKPGSLLKRDALQDYLDRINRFPGRRVDVAVTASGEEAGVVLDYIVRVERPPIFVFDQTSNTGTQASGSWRTRAGFELRQLAGLDDTLDASFDTSLSTATYSAFGSYQVTPIFPDVLKLKVYGGYGRFLAEDVGFDEAKFTGRSGTAGLLATFTPYYFKGFPIDLIGGVEYKNVDIADIGADPQEGHTNFLLPIAGVATDKTTERSTFFASMQIEPNLPGLIGTSSDELQKMGRFDVSKDFIIGKYSFGGSMFLDPLIHRKAWAAYEDEPDAAKRKGYWPEVTLANEVAFLLHGQYTFNDKRLIPQFEDVVGGFASVRGYPEAFAAGDDTVVFSTEYRVHVPRLFKPLDTNVPDDPAKPPPPPPRFALRPPTILGRPDLDVILRAFYDFGYVENNNLVADTEANRTLMSVGVGAEVQVLRYLNVRLDCGFPLLSVTDKTSRPVQAGSPRLSFVGVISY